MAPPGYTVPDGYSVPHRYMNLEPPPKGTDTNTRAYVIFFSYLATCFALAVFVTLQIIARYNALKRPGPAKLPPKKHVYLFALLATSSLLVTWTFMFKQFNWSYQNWLTWRSFYLLDEHWKHWGLWLKQTSLYREYWSILILGNARYWWTHQVFFFALGLGLYLEQKGVRRGIKYTWAFMLLGQIASVSFATNLFFLTLILSPQQSSSSSASNKTPKQKWLGLWLINLFAIIATAYTALLLSDEEYWHHPTAFLPVLLAPHVALLILPFARLFLPVEYFDDEDGAFTDKVYNYMWALCLINGGLMLCKTTWVAYSYGGTSGMSNALWEHPAVSTVGFDVIFCWASWICWILTQKDSVQIDAKKAS